MSTACPRFPRGSKDHEHQVQACAHNGNHESVQKHDARRVDEYTASCDEHVLEPVEVLLRFCASADAIRRVCHSIIHRPQLLIA